MRNLKNGFLVLMLSFGASRAMAGKIEAGSHMLGLGAGASFTVSQPASKFSRQGPIVGMEYLYFPSARVGVGMQIDSISLKQGNGVVTTTVPSVREAREIDSISIQGSVRLNLAMKDSLILPYAGLGLGINRLEQTSFVKVVSTTESTVSALDLTYSALLGFDVFLTPRTTLGLESRCQRLMTDYDDFNSNGITVMTATIRVNRLF